MSRLERHEKKQTRNRFVVTLLIVVVFIWFFLSYGIPFIITEAVNIANYTGAKRNGLDMGAAPEFSSIDISDIPSATNSATIIFTGSVENLKSVTIHLNNQEVKDIDTSNSSSFSTELSGLQSGSNDIYLTGINEKTKEKKESQHYTVSYISNKPKLNITSPSDGYQTPQTEINVVGKTDSNQDLTVRVNGFPVTTDPNGNFHYFVKLNDGENKITVTVTDSAGNTEQKEIKVIYAK